MGLLWRQNREKPNQDRFANEAAIMAKNGYNYELKHDAYPRNRAEWISYGYKNREGIIKRRTELIQKGEIQLPIHSEETQYYMEDVLMAIKRCPDISEEVLSNEVGINVSHMVYALEKAFIISPKFKGESRIIYFDNDEEVEKLVDEVTRLYADRKIAATYNGTSEIVNKYRDALGANAVHNVLIENADIKEILYLCSIIHMSHPYDEFVFLDTVRTGVFDVFESVYNVHIFDKEIEFVNTCLKHIQKQDESKVFVFCYERYFTPFIQHEIIPLLQEEDSSDRISLFIFSQSKGYPLRIKNFIIEIEHRKEDDSCNKLEKNTTEEETTEYNATETELVIREDDKFQHYLHNGGSKDLNDFWDDFLKYIDDKGVIVIPKSLGAYPCAKKLAAKYGQINPVALSYALNIKLAYADVIYILYDDIVDERDDIMISKRFFDDADGPCDIEIMEKYASEYKKGDTKLFDMLLSELNIEIDESYIKKTAISHNSTDTASQSTLEDKDSTAEKYESLYSIAFEDFCIALALRGELKNELTLVYKYAKDNYLEINDHVELISLCNTILANQYKLNDYMFSKSNLQSLIRLINVAEYNGTFEKYYIFNSEDKKTQSTDVANRGDKITFLSGEEFEDYCASLLKENGYINVETTKASGDHGIDIFAEKDFISYAIQCKYYSSPVGNSAVQEAFSGKGFYQKDIAVVMTNNSFTPQAIEEAQQLRVKLWDGDFLRDVFNAHDLA